MKKLEWTDAIAIGVKEIDDEHRSLIDYVNTTIEAIAKNKSHSTIMSAIQNLRKYTVFHFSNEERFMEKHQYKEYAQHCREHENLKKKVKDFQHRLYQDEKIDLDEVRTFFRHWLIEHIIHSDMKLKPCVHSQGQSQPKLMELTQELIINVEEIDQDHREFIATLNSAHEEVENQDKLLALLTKLNIQYLAHIETERTFMASIDYPHMEEHEKAHKELRDELPQIIQLIQYKTIPAEEGLNKCKERIEKHMLEHDAKIRTFLQDM